MVVLPRIFLVALLLAAGLVARPAAAAESYDNCTGFINSLPATISTQGVWCLDKNLGTAITSGAAITIATNNVTIDCNDFKIGGLAAGDESEAVGILAPNRQNATVRHCNVRGFMYGIILGGDGHLVEDNRLDNNLQMGMQVVGDNNRVRRNAVYDTGGSPGFGYSIGIQAQADVIDNTVAGVFASTTNSTSYGIRINGIGNVVRNNRVRGLQASGTGAAYGIVDIGIGSTIDGNQIVVRSTSGLGITGRDVGVSVCSNNVVIGFDTAIADCTDAGGNTGL